MSLKRTALSLTLFTALAFPSYAMAQDLPPAVEAILKNWEVQYQVKPTYKNIEADGDSATIEGLEATIAIPESGTDGVKLTVEKIELSDIGEETDGIIEVGSTAWTNTNLSFGTPEEGFVAAIPEINAEGLYIKVLGDSPSAADKFRASMNIVKKASSGQITVTAGGQTVTADGYEMTWDGDPVTGAGKTSGLVKNVVIPETLLAMADPSGTLKQLGYSTISFDVGGAGEMMNDGTNFGMDFDAYYDVKDAAKLSIGMNATNIPHALMEELQKKPQPDEAALMGMSQGITLGRFLIRIDDQSITKKLLPMLAAMQGMDEATMVANAGAMIQLGLSQVQAPPELTKQIAESVSAYLKDPKSLTISMKPPAPLTVGQLMTINPADIPGAINMLGISVTAND